MLYHRLGVLSAPLSLSLSLSLKDTSTHYRTIHFLDFGPLESGVGGIGDDSFNLIESDHLPNRAFTLSHS